MEDKQYKYPYEKFIKAKPSNPCPICGKGDWCGFNSYLASCMRVEEGAFKSTILSNGQVAYFHWLEDKKSIAAVPNKTSTVHEVSTAPIEYRDRVYRELLRLLSLSKCHKEDLLRRGLSEVEIKENGYKSVPDKEFSWRICKLLLDKGYELSGIPGFYKAQGPRGGRYWTFNRQPGYFIPVRECKGRIQALQRRMDEPERGGKYKLFSGYASRGGCSSGTPAHIAIPREIKDAKIWVTEAPLKADIAAKYLGAVVVGAISANTWKPVIKALTELGCSEMVLAYDMDAVDNLYVARAEKLLKSELKKLGVTVKHAAWDKGKGIDDALAAGANLKIN